MAMIHLVGDSHTQYLEKLIPNSYAHFMGSPTAYNLIEKVDVLEQIIYASRGDTVEPIVMVFGEIDCRVHLIHQSVIQNRTIYSVVKECCDRYLKVIHSFHNVYVWGIIPSQGDENVLDLNYPRYGTKSDRDLVGKMFNSYLKGKCNLIDMSYKFKPHHYIDGVHLGQNAKRLFRNFNLKDYERRR